VVLPEKGGFPRGIKQAKRGDRVWNGGMSAELRQNRTTAAIIEMQIRLGRSTKKSKFIADFGRKFLKEENRP
jgi:hypothetical protein